jgi:membrane protein
MIDELKTPLAAPTTRLGRGGRLFVFQAKLWWHCPILLWKKRGLQLAAALAYRTIFGIVPLMIVVLLIFQSVPGGGDLRQKVKHMVYRQLNLSGIEYAQKPGEEVRLTAKIDEIIGRFFTESGKQTATIFSVVFIVWASIGLLATIEGAFNQIWGVSRGRNWISRIISYWAVLTLGPIFLGAGIYATMKLSPYGPAEGTAAGTIVSAVLSYVIGVVVLFLLYFVLPNTKVKIRAALGGALAAALVWIVARYLFEYYVSEWKPYHTLYGALALVPVTVFWIYATWLIVLFGLELTFTRQHLKALDAAEIAAVTGENYFIANDVTAINVVRQIAGAFEERNAPVESELVANRLNMPPELTERVLDHLVAYGVLVKASEPKVGFMPATDPEKILLSDISDALAAACFAQKTTDQPKVVDEVLASQKNILAQHNVKQMLREMRRQQ